MTTTIATHEQNPSADSKKQARSAKRRAMLGMLVDIAPSLTAVYGLRALGASPYHALLAGTVVAGIPVVYGIVKARRLDPYAGYLMLTFGLGLVVALVTTDPQLVLAGQTLVNGIIAVAFLISCAVRKPLTELLAGRFTTDAPVPSPAMAAAVHGLHTKLSLVAGIGLLLEVAARMVIIFTMPFDVAAGLVNIIGFSAIAVIGVPVAIVLMRFKKNLPTNRA